jgi:hypothetical protein
MKSTEPVRASCLPPGDRSRPERGHERRPRVEGCGGLHPGRPGGARARREAAAGRRMKQGATVRA